MGPESREQENERGFFRFSRENLATAASNWEERKRKDNKTFRLISLVSKLATKKSLLKCQVFQTRESEGFILFSLIFTKCRRKYA